MKIFSKRLKEERESLGLTQKDMAERLGISTTRYKNYEHIGEPIGREPSFEMLCKIAKVLNVSADYLLGLKEI